MDTVAGFIVLRGDGDADKSEDLTQHRCAEKERTAHYGTRREEGRRPRHRAAGKVPRAGHLSGVQEKELA